MNIRRTLVSLLSTIVVTLTMLGIVLINAQTSDEEPDLSYRTLDYDVAVQERRSQSHAAYRHEAEGPWP